eukprot:66229-Pleurochrysis_carterae.AAC.1
MHWKSVCGAARRTIRVCSLFAMRCETAVPLLARARACRQRPALQSAVRACRRPSEQAPVVAARVARSERGRVHG